MTDTDLIKQKIDINIKKLAEEDFKLNEIQVTELRKRHAMINKFEKGCFNKQIDENKNQFARDVYQSIRYTLIKFGLE